MTRRTQDGARPRLARLKRRSEFLRAAKRGRKWATPGLVLQAYTREESDRDGAETSAPRVGFTASRKVGNAVLRNRARRRLRAVADRVLPQAAKPGTDYVLIARAETVSRPYMELVGDLEAALRHVGERRARASGRSRAREAHRRPEAGRARTGSERTRP